MKIYKYNSYTNKNPSSLKEDQYTLCYYTGLYKIKDNSLFTGIGLVTELNDNYYWYYNNQFITYYNCYFNGNSVKSTINSLEEAKKSLIYI